jgi:hypothetical protein
MNNKQPPLRISPLDVVKGKIIYESAHLQNFINGISAVESILKYNTTTMQNEEYHKIIHKFKHDTQLTRNKIAKLKKDYKTIKHKQLTKHLNTVSKQLDDCLITHIHKVLPLNNATQTELSQSRIKDLRDNFNTINSLLRNYTTTQLDHTTTTPDDPTDANIIISRHNINKRQHIDKKKRQLLFETYYPGKKSAYCWCCNSTVITKETPPDKKKSNWDCGHVVSHHSGGNTDLSNLRPICVGCNQGMKTQHMFLYKASLFV